jgi:hypothetical protein
MLKNNNYNKYIYVNYMNNVPIEQIVPKQIVECSFPDILCIHYYYKSLVCLPVPDLNLRRPGGKYQ